MDIWKRMYEKAKEQYHPEEVSPFIYAHNVVCAIEAENGDIYTGFCIESCSGVMNICADRLAALNMYANSGQTKIKRFIAFRDSAPNGGGSGMPCGACQEFFYQLNEASNGVQREHNKKLNNGLPILHKVPPKRDYGRYFCIMAEKGGTSHGGLTEKLSLFFHAKKQEVNAYGR